MATDPNLKGEVDTRLVSLPQPSGFAADAKPIVDPNARRHVERPRIASPWLVAVLAVAVLLTLYAAYPRGGLRGRMTSSAVPSALSVAYLEAWLRIQPDNEEFLSILGTQYVSLGQADDAERIAAQMEALHSVDLHREATMLRLSIAEQRAYAIPEGDPRRAAAMAVLRERIAAAARLAWPNHDLQSLALRAVTIDDPELAMQLYARLAEQDPAHRERWNAEVSRYALQIGDYRHAADIWFHSEAIATTLADRRHCFIEGIRTLQSGNLLDDAIQAADQHAGALVNDKETLVVLLNLARAAHRTDLVERYAKALAQYASAPMKPAGRIELASYVQRLAAVRPFTYMDGSSPPRHVRNNVVVHIITVAASAPGGDTDVAGLVYQSFVETHDLDNAQRIATEKVTKDPRSTVWLKRLAQVAEWNNGAPLALKTWLAYAQLTNDPEGWKNVLRLAPMLDDDNAYLAGIVWKARGSPDNLKLVDEVTATYERLGRPADAFAFLRSLPRGRESIAIDERSAALAERAGYDDQAIALYRRLQQRDPHNTGYALHTASLLYRHDDQVGAFAALGVARDYATDSNVEFWRNYGQLARLLELDSAANEAYKHLLASRQATPEDLEAMTYFYDPYPIDAGRTSELQYERDHTPRALQSAIYYYTEAGAMDRIATLLTSLTDDQRTAAEATPGFLGVRAEYYRQIGQPTDALHDLQRAVNLPGATDDLRASLLWTLVDYGNDSDVREALARWRAESETTASLWGPYAAGEMRLNRPVAALRYLRRQTATLSRDPLWQLTYADAQEMVGRRDLAWTIRRSVWREMQNEEGAVANAHGTRSTGSPSVSQDEDTREEWRGRRVTLGSIFANGDVSKALLESLITTDGGKTEQQQRLRTLVGDTPGLASLPAPPANQTSDGRLKSAVAKEVAVAWALSQEADPLAKRWLARQYATRLAQPSDSRLTIALAENDVSEMERLLAEERGRLPRYDRIDALVAIDRPGEAEQLAFDGVDGAPADDEMHTRLVETATTWPQSIDAGIASYSQHPLDYIESTLGASLKIADHYMIGVATDERFQHTTNTTELINVPADDRSVSFTARRQTIDTAFQVTAGRREALDSFYTFALEGELGRNSPLTFTFNAGRNQTATESQELQVGGVKDNVIAGFDYRATSRIYLNGSLEGDRFYSQDRGYLGSGLLTRAEIGYKIRTDYPDYTVRLVGLRGSYGASGQADPLISKLVPASFNPNASTFMPPTYFQYGLYFTFGTDLMEQYTHEWRPFLDVGIAHDSLQGWGPQVDIGVAGSVFGGDHAAIYFEHQSVSQRGTSVTIIGARYSWFY